MPRRRRRVEKWLTETTTPVFVLDTDLVIGWFNTGCEQLTGWSAEDVLGWRCDYNSEFAADTVDALVASLCPPPDLALSTVQQVPVEVACRDGHSQSRILHVFPLEDADGQPDGFLGVLQPVPQGDSATLTDSPTHRLHAELAALRVSLRQRYGIDTLLGAGPAMTRVLQQVELAVESLHGIALTGEPGSGREHAARAIHYAGPNGDHSFIPLHAVTLPPNEQAGVIDRILGPRQSQLAGPDVLQPGTLFLAEVEQFPRDIQQRLLDRFAEDTERQPTLRLMASSTMPLEQAVASEQLLPELHYRLTAITIPLPALRDRSDDFRPLTQHFLEQHNQSADFQIGGLAPSTWTALGQYLWPGNLDELDAVIREAAQAAADRESSRVEVQDLPFRFRTGLDAQRSGPPLVTPLEPLDIVVERVEREHIRQALDQARGNKAGAARLLGLTRPKLYRRLQSLDMLDDAAHETDG